MNKQLNLWKEQSDDNKLLIAKLLDKIKFTKNKNKFETTDFLDLREQAILTEEINRIKFEQYKLWGGYDNSERKIILLFPEKIELDYIDNTVFDQFLTIIRVKLPNELNGQLEHRNYLGGLMKLGIKREKIGDIIVRDDGADIIVKNEISEYIKNNIQSLSRFKKSIIEVKKIEELILVEPKKEILKINVPSMRLDCFIGELARCSRNEANTYLKEERIFVNFKEEIKSSKIIKEGDYITIRGKGRFKINRIIGNTKSGRISVEVEK